MQTSLAGGLSRLHRVPPGEGPSAASTQGLSPDKTAHKKYHSE